MINFGEVENELIKQGIDLTQDVVYYHKEVGSQCFATGKFTGYSVRDLIEIYCRANDKLRKQINIDLDYEN